MASHSNRVHTVDRPGAWQALSTILTEARKGKSAPLREQRSGRCDRKRLHRVAVADNRVFIERRAPAPQKVRVTILVDASTSMNGYPNWSQEARELGQSTYQIACQTARDLAGATNLLPWVTADIVAFTTGQPGVVLYPLWKSGQPLTTLQRAAETLRMGGTEEGYALAFAADEQVENRQSGEQSLVIILSDGAPSEPAHVKWVVGRMAAQDIPVVSVALTASSEQPKMYGKDNVVKYHNSPRALARDMAKVIGRVL